LAQDQATHRATHIPQKQAMASYNVASYSIGDKVDVFSISQQKWLKGLVSAVGGGMVTVEYMMPDGSQAQKQLPELGHQHLRRQQVSGVCRNGCGWTAFGKHPTCCTRCKGPGGPHALDCNQKNQRIASAPAVAQAARAAAQAPPAVAHAAPAAVQASPTTAAAVKIAPPAVVAVQPASRVVNSAAVAEPANPTMGEETPLKWSSPRDTPIKVPLLGEKSTTDLQADTVRRLERLIQHGDLNGANRAYARARHLKVDVGILQSTRTQLEALHLEGEFSLFAPAKTEK